jgi:hypothetical protein
MDSSKKYRIDQWVEDALYGHLEKVMTHRQIIPADATTLTPLIQMYQAIQLENVSSQLESFWQLLSDGHVGIYIRTTYERIGVNVKEVAQNEQPQPKKGR